MYLNFYSCIRLVPRKLADTLCQVHRVAVWAAQTVVIALSALLAFQLRFDLSLPQAYVRSLIWGTIIWIGIKSIVFRLFALDRGWWNYVSLNDMVRLAVGNLVGSVCSCCVILLTVPISIPRSIYILDLLICFLGTCGIRIAVRLLSELTPRRECGLLRHNVLIYGAGQAGVMLMREIQNNPKLPYCVRGFVDDISEKRGARFLGVTVLGTGEELGSLVQRHKIEVVLVAIPSAIGTQMTRIIELCLTAQVQCRTVPGLGEIIEGRELAGQIREVAVEDLLGRKPVKLKEDQIYNAIRGRTILVTGAGGSIGSELCRQIARFEPAEIIGFDCAESALFEVDREIRAGHEGIKFHAEIGNIQNQRRLSKVFSQYLPNVVFHAAAYKHVPLMETHVFEAMENNIFGTYNVAVAAANYGVEDFVLISTDKAVAPTSLMGATKRFAELMISDLQGCGTKYVAVRFGNVLGSNGSVIPIFKKQIAAGGPVTVTHPEMRRFFMTIPEACQLVLQAAAIAKGGQIFVLDMDQPVKIVDLARKLIILSGLKPNLDIGIKFTGVRPGEKLVEQLSSVMENTIPSEHEKIRIFVGNGQHGGEALKSIKRLREICETRDIGALLMVLKDLLPDYNPSAQILHSLVNALHNAETPNSSPAELRSSLYGEQSSLPALKH
jgi:FlaA1/EpsC-like NDP-sugar epimerase